MQTDPKDGFSELIADWEQKGFDVRLKKLLSHLESSGFPLKPLNVRLTITPKKGNLLFCLQSDRYKEEFLLENYKDKQPLKHIRQLRLLPAFLLSVIAEQLENPTSPNRDTYDLLALMAVWPVTKPPNLTLISLLYPILHGAWKEVKKAHKKSCDKNGRPYSNWKDTAWLAFNEELENSALAGSSWPWRIQYEKGNFDELLERLTISEFPEEKYRDRSPNAPASELALDHAAYLCGVNPFQYLSRTLRGYLKPATKKRSRKPKANLQLAR